MPLAARRPPPRTIQSTALAPRPTSIESVDEELVRRSQRRAPPMRSGSTRAWRTPQIGESSALLRVAIQPFGEQLPHALQLGLAEPLVRHHLREHSLGGALENRVADARQRAAP